MKPTQPWPDPPSPYRPRPLRYQPSMVEQDQPPLVSWEFLYLLAVLSPWLISVVVKVWIGDWTW